MDCRVPAAQGPHRADEAPSWPAGSWYAHVSFVSLRRALKCYLFHVADLSDPISEYTYMTLLRGCAALNSGVYDELDSDLSVYRCRSMQQFSSALSKKQNKSFHDLRVREITKSIKGFLVFFPLDFLNDSLLCVNTPVSASGVSAQSLWV